jgi:zinc protease
MELTPDRANANLRGVLPMPLSDTDADYPALLMANYLFGAGGSSRLWKRIRESGGLSYDVRSVVDWNPDEANSTWNVSAIFAPQNQPRVEAALREELALSVKEGFTQKELDEARVGLLNLRRLSRAQDGNVASQLASDQRLGRRFAFAQQVDQAIEKLSLDQVNAAWRKYIDPARVVLAWGGDFKAAP